jgi:hypothetical protein
MAIRPNRNCFRVCECTHPPAPFVTGASGSMHKSGILVSISENKVALVAAKQAADCQRVIRQGRAVSQGRRLRF